MSNGRRCDLTLGSYGIKHGSTIYMMIILRGGGGGGM